MPTKKEVLHHEAQLTEASGVAAQAAPGASGPEPSLPADHEEVIYSHSALFYWWPVWAVGFAMAGLTYWGGQSHAVGAERVWFHSDSNLGVIFFLALFLVILMTNVTVRGMASVLVIVSAIVVTLLLAYLRLWDPILAWFGDLKIQLNLGAYFWFSLLMFLAWAAAVFIFDRMSYWRIRPGQVTREFVLGAAAKSYDTTSLTLEKRRDDLFRHWALGFGSGDLIIRPFGAQREELAVPNVLFLGSKLPAMQRLVSMEPEA